ncbi:hypothetical protein BH23ACT9_BH23ACT9_07260 [soil metagenome]
MTVVTKDYPGFDTESDLDRPGVFRLNAWVGRVVIAELATMDADPATRDVWLPHPVYATQGWLSIVMPSDERADEVQDVLAHADAVARHRPDGHFVGVLPVSPRGAG